MLKLFKDSQLTISEASVRFPADTIAVGRCQSVREGHVSPEGKDLPARTGIFMPGTFQDISKMVDHRTVAQNTDIIEGALSRPQ